MSFAFYDMFFVAAGSVGFLLGSRFSVMDPTLVHRYIVKPKSLTMAVDFGSQHSSRSPFGLLTGNDVSGH